MPAVFVIPPGAPDVKDNPAISKFSELSFHRNFWLIDVKTGFDCDVHKGNTFAEGKLAMLN